MRKFRNVSMRLFSENQSETHRYSTWSLFTDLTNFFMIGALFSPKATKNHFTMPIWESPWKKIEKQFFTEINLIFFQFFGHFFPIIFSLNNQMSWFLGHSMQQRQYCVFFLERFGWSALTWHKRSQCLEKGHFEFHIDAFQSEG